MKINTDKYIKHKTISIDDKTIVLKNIYRTYNNEEKVITLINQINEVVLQKKPLNQFIHIGEQRSEIFEIIMTFPDEIIDEYINSMLHKALIKRSIKPHDMSVIINDVIKVMILDIKNISNVIAFVKNKGWFIDLKERICFRYNKYLKERIEDFISAKRLLSTFPSEIVTEKNKFKVFVEHEFSELQEYVDFLIDNGLKNKINDTKNLKNSEAIVPIIEKQIFEQGNSFLALQDTVESREKYIEFMNFVKERYSIFIRNLVFEYINKNEKLSKISRRIATNIDIFRAVDSIDKHELKNYLEYWIEQFSKERRPLIFFDFISDVIGIEGVGNLKTKTSIDIDISETYEYIKLLIDQHYDKYGEKLISNNQNQIKLDKDKWIMVYKKGPTYKFKEFDFSGIKSQQFKYELKLYIKDEISRRPFNVINSLSLVIPCVNYIYNNNSMCSSLGRISKEDIRILYIYLSKEYTTIHNKKLEPASIQKMIGKLKVITGFIMDFGKKNNLITLIPVVNHFKKITFKNLKNMSKKTEIIPNIVIEQLEKYKTELVASHQLIFNIFINSGLRLKEVMELEADCLDDTQWDNIKILKYKPYKVSNRAKKISREPFNEIMIPKDVAEEIEQQKNDTNEIRKKYSLDFIFVRVNSKYGKVRANMLSGNGFVKAINSLIQKHNIVDDDGVLWNFTSRQMRKTVVVTMIENGATKSEIAYVLGHYNNKTLETYYEDVRDKRIEEMNNEFFKNKFKINIGEEHLKQFTEEERKILYIDFILDCRKVELGFCTKHYKDGRCGKVVGNSNCAKCSKMCTGKQFLDEWIRLRDSSKHTVIELKKFYHKKNITEEEYKNFKEYEIEADNLKLYQDVIDKLERSN